jgi:hypothetical protein
MRSLAVFRRKSSIVRSWGRPARWVIMTAVTAVALGSLSMATRPAIADTTVVTFQDVNPVNGRNNEGAGAGGRVNGLAAASNGTTYYAASERGGLFRSTDSGVSWARFINFGPMNTWDVEVAPANDAIIFATAFFDGRTSSTTRSGVLVSYNSGATWSAPTAANHPSSSATGCAFARIAEPNAYGIAVSSSQAFVGTSCGLAIASIANNTWSVVDPKRSQVGFPSTTVPSTGPAGFIFDVVAHHSGILDTCGEEGHWHSTNSGVGWSKPSASFGGQDLPKTPLAGSCSIVASPDEANVLFAVVGTTLYESNNSGYTWTLLDGIPQNNPSPQGRIPFLEVDDRTTGFDLWFGDVSLFRRPCVALFGLSRTRCPPTSGRSDGIDNDNTKDVDELDEGWRGVAGNGGGFTRTAGAHDDAGSIIFDRRVTIDRCPTLFSSDGGVYLNTRTSPTGSATCFDPRWREATSPPHAWWIYAMAGYDRNGQAEDLYVGMQDNGLWAHNMLGAPAAQTLWNTPSSCCDVYDIATDGSAVPYTFLFPYQTNVCTRSGTGCSQWLSAPTGGVAILSTYVPALASFGNGADFLFATTGGIFKTNFMTPPPQTFQTPWTRLGNVPAPGGFCSVYTSGNSGLNFTAFGETGGGCAKDQPKQVWQISSSGTTWAPVPGPTNTGGFGIFAVHPVNPSLMYGLWIETSFGAPAASLVRSDNGGTSWTYLRELDAAVLGDVLYTGTRTFVPKTQLGMREDPKGSYFQPNLIALDPKDTNVIVVAGHDSGLFISTNAGKDWARLVNGVAGTGSLSAIPHARSAYFDNEPNMTPQLYIGTEGLGVWRVLLVTADLVLGQNTGGDFIGTGGLTHIRREIRNGLNTAGEVTLYQALPPGVRWHPGLSSNGCVSGLDAQLGGGFRELGSTTAVRCKIPSLAPGHIMTIDLVVEAINDGNQVENCREVLAPARVYSNALDRNLGDNVDSEFFTVCR